MKAIGIDTVILIRCGLDRFIAYPSETLMTRKSCHAAAKIGYDKAITFEFSHFMSPQSVYGAAGNLYRRYREYFAIA